MVMQVSEQMKKSAILLSIVLGLILVANLLSQRSYFKIDLTEDKRYTLTPETRKLLESIDREIFVSVLLDGELSAEYKRLKNSALDVLEQFQAHTPYLDILVEDPSRGTIEQVNENREALKEMGIAPVNDLRTQKLLYPHAVFAIDDRGLSVNMLEQKVMGVDPETTINNSIALLEYKFANAIQKLNQGEKKVIRFVTGQGELSQEETVSLQRSLQRFYFSERFDLDEVSLIPEDTDLLIIAKPQNKYSDKDIFKIDQYIMNGGKVFFFLDQTNAALDSINRYGQFIASAVNHGLDDLLFSYGIRINNDLIADLSSSRIPQIIGSAGGKAQTEMFDWYFHPVVVPSSNHPIVKNIGPIGFEFVSTIDTLPSKTKVKKEILLQSSPYTRVQKQPVQLDFNILQFEPDVNQFNQGQQFVSVLLEGQFESAYRNRLTSDLKDLLSKSDREFTGISDDAKIMVVSDGDVFKSLYNSRSKSFTPIGFNKWENYVFEGNEKFVLNAIDYMVDDIGLLNARNREVKLRLLNMAKISEEKLKWQLLNLLGPILFLIVFGIVYFLVRKYKYQIH